MDRLFLAKIQVSRLGRAQSIASMNVARELDRQKSHSPPRFTGCGSLVSLAITKTLLLIVQSLCVAGKNERGRQVAPFDPRLDRTEIPI
jgi:hypothetical protein